MRLEGIRGRDSAVDQKVSEEEEGGEELGRGRGGGGGGIQLC